MMEIKYIICTIILLKSNRDSMTREYITNTFTQIYPNHPLAQSDGHSMFCLLIMIEFL